MKTSALSLSSSGLFQRRLSSWIAMSGFVLLAAPISAPAQAAESPAATPAPLSETASDYGELYLLEQKQGTGYDYQIGFRGTYEFSNPYYNVYSYGLDASKTLSNWARVGIQFNKYSVSNNALSPSLAASLNDPNATKTVLRPSLSTYAMFTLIPLSGHLNFFSHTVVPIDLAVGLGPGWVGYDDHTSTAAMQWDLDIEVGLSELVYSTIGFGQEIEAPFGVGTAYRTQAQLGLGLRF